MFSIDTADNTDAIKQNGDEVEFSFYTMVYRWAFFQLPLRWVIWDDVYLQMTNLRILTDTASVQLEPTQPMSCSVSSSFETENKTEIGNMSVSKINENFELSSDDIRLVSDMIFSKAFWRPLVSCNC